MYSVPPISAPSSAPGPLAPFSLVCGSASESRGSWQGKVWVAWDPPMKDTQGRRRRPMTKHKTGTREEWLAARLELLKAEKALTRRSDELAQRRQDLPWVRVDKEYRFETDEGMASLVDLFRGRSQLLIYHFMFGPEYRGGCPACSAIADGFNGFAVHL